jgi:type I phosphodiesterase/nucleotide pyrophosphatase
MERSDPLSQAQPADADPPSRAGLLPLYDGQSLLNVAASICSALGALDERLPPSLDAAILPPALLHGVRAVLLLVVDGLGRGQLDAAIEQGQAPTLAALAARAAAGDEQVASATITSVFPSSTIPALATLNSALPPANHGLIGWTVFLEEFGEVAELARWGPVAGAGSYLEPRLGGHDPRAFAGFETLYQRLGRAGVASTVIGPAVYRRSALTQMLYAGADYQGYYATSSSLPLATAALAQPGPPRRYVYCYWDALDLLAHLRGPHSPEHQAELATVDFALGRWLDHQPRHGDLLFLLTADHGHVATPAEHLVRLDQPELLSLLRAPASGERRLAYLHARPGQEAVLRAYCQEHLSPFAELVDPATAFEQHWFGPHPPSATARRRAGDLLLLAKDAVQLVSPTTPGGPFRTLLGNHGGQQPSEMLVPLLAVRI